MPEPAAFAPPPRALPGLGLDLSVFGLWPGLVHVLDARERLVYSNLAAERSWGVALEAGLDEVFAAVHREDLEAAKAAVRAALAGETRTSVRLRLIHDAEREDEYTLCTGPLRTAEGQITGAVAVAQASSGYSPIPVQRSSVESDSVLRRVLDATADLVVIATLEGRITHLNAAARRITGCDMEPSGNGELALARLHPAWAYEIIAQEGIPMAIEHGHWEGETAVRDHAGREIPVAQVILARFGPGPGGAFLATTMRDISDRKRDEITRMEWANRYDAAIRASGQLLFDWNSATNDITYAGDVLHFLGFSMAEMAGGLERFRQLIFPEDRAEFDREVQRVLATRDPFRLDFRLVRKDGAILDIAAKGYFFLDREGHIGRMVGFFADVTAQKAAQDALARAHENLELRVEQRTAELARAYTVIRDRAHQQEAVAQLGQRALVGTELPALLQQATGLVQRILDVDFCTIVQVSPDGEELFTSAQSGFAEGALPKRIPAGPNSQSGYTIQVREAVLVEDMAQEERFEVSGAIRAVGAVSSVSVAIEGAERPHGVLGAFSLTPRKFLQDDVHFLQSLANVLTAAMERQQAEESISQAREQAESANRAKSEFLSRMSHELRTPLNAILGFTQLLEMDHPTPSQAESFEHISRAGQHLLSLINEVLDIARIEAGRLSMASEPIEIGVFVREVVELVRPLANRHQIATSFVPTEAGQESVMGDRQRLKQVFLNLLSNAIKYNRPDGRVTVRCLPVSGDRIRIEVTDTGRGISEEQRQRLFLPFERLGAEDSDIEGTGIGLALSRGIVAALKGEMGVESTPDVGSTFWVCLPRAAAAAPEPPPPPAPSPVAATVDEQQTLLYIEDQDLNLRLVERILRPHAEYRLLTAMQGGLGLELAREHRPNLILLDLNLPDMSGDEVLRQIKADPTTQHIPVIMVSADAMGDRVDQMLELGASGYLTKPYRVADFLRLIGENTGLLPKATGPSAGGGSRP